MAIHAHETLDCASKVRIHYLLTQPITLQQLQIFPPETLSVQAFSKQVKGAKDHFTISLNLNTRVTGVIGEMKIITTFGKTTQHRPVNDIQQFEALLMQLDPQEIVYHKHREAVV